MQQTQGNKGHTSVAASYHITDIESAINYWREQWPTPSGEPLAPPLAALAEVYARMAVQGHHACDTLPPAALDAWLAWYDTTPDTPCIAICSTSQGDEVCKGCGRTFEEVQHWPGMQPVEKRDTWHRITLEGDAWRFTKYAERAQE
ncbi:DUF3717 domain-containing protein [Curvibacter sp. CHRR-16]|uniref:DUF3717 domain-containing protein n=1 Tax=Curvibacter sp. CHRR-16 TaxID=2835872 RepID=UPI0032E9F135